MPALLQPPSFHVCAHPPNFGRCTFQQHAVLWATIIPTPTPPLHLPTPPRPTPPSFPWPLISVPPLPAALPDRRLKLPAKRIFTHSQSVDFVEERREALNRYLQAALANDVVAGKRGRASGMACVLC